MTDHTRLLFSGSVFPDVNHERLFLRVRHGTRVQFMGGSIDGDRVLRLVDNLDITQAALPVDLFERRSGGEFSLFAHVATAEERVAHDDVTEPTLTVDRIVPFAAIQRRAFQISQDRHSGSALDNWLRAELELLTGADAPARR
jgi:hypothetical protein